MSVAVAGLLRLLAADRPVLIAIDDAQWLDESTAAILAYALRRLVDQPVGLLATVRTGTETPASDGLLAAVPPDRLERVELGPMHLAALHRLFQVRLGRSFPRLVLVRIEEASGGNPLYALELGRALLRDGIPADAHGTLPVPDSLGSLIAGRVSRLPEPTRHAMLLAAAAAEPTVATLERASPGIEADLRPAVEDQLVVIEDGVVRFAHPLFAQSVLSLAPATELRAAHEALSGATQSEDARARHLAHAADGPDETVAATLEQAAEHARNRGATLDAASLYQEASRLTPSDDPVAALDRARLAAECLFIDVSEYLEADRILEAAIDRAPPGPARADALSLRAIIRYYHGRVPEAIELGEQALAEAGDDPGLRGEGARAARVPRDAARPRARRRPASTRPSGSSRRRRTDEPVDPDTLANVLLLRAVGEIGLVRPTRPGDVERGLGLISTGGRSWEKEGAEGSAFGLARMTDDLDRAIAMTRETIRAKSGPGGDDPFNVVHAVGPPPLPRRLARGAAPGRGGGGRIPARRVPRSIRRGRSAGWRSSRRTTAGSTTRAPGRPRALRRRRRARRRSSSPCSTTTSSASSRSRPRRGTEADAHLTDGGGAGRPDGASGTRGGSSSRATRSRRRSRWATSSGRRRSSNGWTRRRASPRRRGSSPSAPARRRSSRRRGVISTGRSTADDGDGSARQPADAVRARQDAAREGPPPSSPEGEATRRRDAARGARRASSRSGRRTGPRSRGPSSAASADGRTRPTTSPTPSGGSPSSRPPASPAARSPSARSSPRRRSATCSAGSTRSSGSTRGPSSAP